MKKLYLFGIILILFLASVIVINSQNVSIVNTTPSSVVFKFGNVNVTTKASTLNFNKVIIADNYIQFNDTKIYVSSTNPVNVTLNYLHPNLVSLDYNDMNTLGINFTAKCSGGTAWFNISGFTPGLPDEYTFYKNSTLLGTYAADSQGIIHLPISSWSWGYITGVLTGSSGNNIRSDGDYLYMTAEDGLIPYFKDHRATHIIDTNSTIEGKYCVNATYTNTPAGAFYDRFYFDTHIKPTTWSMKFIIDDYTTDTKLQFLINRHLFGATIMGLNIYPIAGTFQTYGVGGITFTMPFKFNIIYTMTYSNIDYVAHTYSVTIANATASETKNGISFFSLGAGNFELNDWEFRGQDAGVNHRLFYDDWAVGQQTLIDSNEPTNIKATSTTANGLIVNDGSTLQNNSQKNLTARIYYAERTHEVNYTYYFNKSSTTRKWNTNPYNMNDSNENTYASTNVFKSQLLTDNTGNITTTRPGNISYVGIRAKSNISLNAHSGKISLRPIFNNTNGSIYNIFSDTTRGWSDWIDITKDGNAPATWSWDNITTLNCYVIANLTQGIAYVGKVEIKVIVNGSKDYAYNRTVNGNYTGESLQKSLSLTPGKLYFYRAYGATNYTNASSYGWGDEKYFLTKPEAPTNAKYSIVNKTTANISWVKGTGANTTVVVRKTTGYPTSVADGTIVYNGTGTYKVLSGLASGDVFYYRAWGFKNWTFNPTLYHFSDNHSDFPFGALALGCYNESKPWQNITFDIQISNETGSEVYVAHDCTSYHTINATLCPHGLITMYFTAEGYKGRIYTTTLNPGVWLVFDAYLPPLYTATNDTTAVDCEMRTFTDTKTVTNHTVDAMINLSHAIDTIISVELYNKSLYGTYGGWITVPNNKYNITSNSKVIVNESVLDANTTMVQANYYYQYCPGIETKLYLLTVVNQNNMPVKDAFVQIKRYINTTDIYEPVLSAYTDGNGQMDCYLIPLVPYKVFITASGYIDEIADYIPSLLIYTHTFMLDYEQVTPPSPLIESETIIFTGTIYGNYLNLSYLDKSYQTINTHILVYQTNISTKVKTVFYQNSKINDSDFYLNFSIDHANCSYEVILFYNHTIFNFNTRVLVFHGTWTPPHAQPFYDNLFTKIFGYCPFLWTNIFMFMLMVAGFFYADARWSGIILVILGIVFLFVGVVIGFNSVLSTAAGGVVPILFIIVGAIVEWNVSRRVQ